MKALQQKCRDLHIKIGGNKEEVVRRLTAHMIDRDYVQLAASGATFGSRGMSQHFRTEGYAAGQPSSDLEDSGGRAAGPPAHEQDQHRVSQLALLGCVV